ncbi:MAG: NADH-quinone oxidoreductase subunit A [Desulfofustis sp. PB-SRB1]|jgi:NADH-quinone oxidoreductase subunit A|nr:NADH-quinone oxidoreductase subunit A [Desulfofustis sp. PB-SRB1]MBM1002217.1 NADH-quinone oxidoreductase subunit A [Desulfofustis sp. PB-SRB1]HBH28207.1 NADH-quinone oxidoreductase [Desulfofustis sp.]HBH32262.1 NADH-quinone oxidoreductase [Desulfofustis sp.]
MSAELVLSGVLFFGLVVLLPLIMLATAFLGPRAQSAAKNEPYESGIKPMVGRADQKFSVKFYLLAILFLIFDIETVFMLPWAVSLRELGLSGFIEMSVFILLLFTGLIYVLSKGVLNWR